MSPKFAAIVLAAGEGRRFGGVKQLALWRGRPMLRWAVEAARGVREIDPVVVVLGAHAMAVRGAVDLSDVIVVEATDWEEGQAASLRAGVMALGEVAAVVILLADNPSVDSMIVAEALDRWSPAADVVRTMFCERPGHPVILGRRALERVADLRGDVGARAFMDELEVVEWEAAHLTPSTDIDTQEALELATRSIAWRSGPR